MEQPQDSSIFGLNIDLDTKHQLSEAAKWGRTLGIVGFCFCALLLIRVLFFNSDINELITQYKSQYDLDPSMAGVVKTAVTIVYFIGAVIYFFVFFFLYRFAVKMKTALATNNQDQLNSSFQNLKILFRYICIIAIVILCFAVLGMIGSLGAGVSRI